jgi:glycosyltransferase involved in cell wall biosynthesis
MPALSVCIIAKNEAAAIARCIEAVKPLSDDIVVVDSGSTDGTMEIARSLGARAIFHAWPGYGPQKRFAEDQARNDWILNVDADEVVTPGLAAEIAGLLSADPPYAAYRFRVPTVYPGWTRPRLWADDYNIARLYDRRRVRYADSVVHDRLELKGQPVGQLQGAAFHFSYRSIAHMREKLDAYTDLQAKVLKRSRLGLAARLPFEYPVVFLRYYVFRRHFTGGLYGAAISHAIAVARTRRIVKLLKAGRERPDAHR